MCRKFHYFSILLVVAAMMPFALTGASQAGIISIVEDTFTASDGTAIPGRAPDTANLPGGTYMDTTSGWYFGGVIYSNRARLQTDDGASVSIASTVTYTKPASFGISGLLNVGDIGNDTNCFRGVGLGFYQDATQYGNSFNGFIGLVLKPDGDLNLVDSLAGAWPTLVEALSYGAGWDATADHTLSYWVDTATGGISQVVLDGVSRSFAATTIFTGPKTPRAGFYANSATGGDHYAYVDNFTVSIPEPSTLALLATGLIGLLCYAWRKRR